MAGKHILIGHLGKEAELKYLDKGTAVVNFSLAVDAVVKGEKQTVWYNLSWFGARAEKVHQYLTKGKHIQAVCDNLTVYEWEKEGKRGYNLQAVVADVELLGGGEKAAEVPF